MGKYKDPVEIARGIFDEFLSKHDPESVPAREPEGKDPKAQGAGRKGSKKGGPARAAKLSAKRRRSIAKKAAQSRWDKS